MEAQEIVATLQQRGANIRARDDGRLEVSSRRALDDELRKAIRCRKADLLALLRHSGPPHPHARQDEPPGAVLIHSRKYGEVWVTHDPGTAERLHDEEANRPEPRPVVASQAVLQLNGKPEALIQAFLRIAVVFPGSRIQ